VLLFLMTTARLPLDVLTRQLNNAVYFWTRRGAEAKARFFSRLAAKSRRRAREAAFGGDGGGDGGGHENDEEEQFSLDRGRRRRGRHRHSSTGILRSCAQARNLALDKNTTTVRRTQPVVHAKMEPDRQPLLVHIFNLGRADLRNTFLLSTMVLYNIPPLLPGRTPRFGRAW
jgi:hypothetical protein